MRAAKEIERLKSASPAKVACSRQAGQVSSSQDDVHTRLRQTVQRHLERRWAQPLHRPTVDAYQRLQQECPFTGKQPFILDSGCGTGASTQQLAGLYPGHLVLGVDRSQVRLAKSSVEQCLLQRENYILLRSDLLTLWRLLLRDGHIPDKQFLLYPNPWPKPGHLQRRWHGHPVFPYLLALGGEIEMRCNWEIYALEFAQAASFVLDEPVVVKPHRPSSSISPFERKYHARAQPLFSVTLPRNLTATFRRMWHRD